MLLKVSQHFSQIAVYLGRAHITQSKRDHAGNTGSTYRDNPAKIQIMRQDHTPLGAGLLNNPIVVQLLKSLFTQVNSIMPPGAQEGNRTTCQAHIGKELHAGAPIGM